MAKNGDGDGSRALADAVMSNPNVPPAVAREAGALTHKGVTCIFDPDAM